MSEELWRNILTTEDFGETLVPSQDLDEVISIMIENKIDLIQKFSGNLFALLSRRMPMIDADNPNLPITPSVERYISIVNRPPLPLWLLAGFPDVIVWLNEKQQSLFSSAINEEEATKAIAKLYGFDLDSNDIYSKSNINNWDGSLCVYNYRNIIRNYVAQTGKKLEVAVVSGARGDIYLAERLGKMIGEESNHTLIATVTTKYYVELKTHYADYFSDETSLLAMSGILDANVYILTTGQVQPEEIVDLAKSTQGKDERLLEFIILFEALLLKVENPDYSHEELLEGCRNQAKAIERSIKKVLTTYQREPRITDNVKAMMTLTQFSHLRNTAGVSKKIK